MTLIATFVFTNVSACSEIVKKNMAEEYEKGGKFYSLVETYITKTKGWSSNDYCIELNRQHDNVLVFWVIHKEDETNISPGGGKSVEVHVDQVKMEVINELGFQ